MTTNKMPPTAMVQPTLVAPTQSPLQFSLPPTSIATKITNTTETIITAPVTTFGITTTMATATTVKTNTSNTSLTTKNTISATATTIPTTETTTELTRKEKVATSSTKPTKNSNGTIRKKKKISKQEAMKMLQRIAQMQETLNQHKKQELLIKEAKTDIINKKLALEVAKRKPSPTPSLSYRDIKIKQQEARKKMKLESIKAQKLKKSLASKRKKLCLFYTKYGECKRISEGCPYLHDQSKIAICSRFVHNRCPNPAAQCLLSHTLDREKMPHCLHFLRGNCSKADCPYVHVKLNDDAPICVDFSKGHCPLGVTCQNKHLFFCPDFEKSQECSKGKRCLLTHRKKFIPVQKTEESENSNDKTLVGNGNGVEDGDEDEIIFFDNVNETPSSSDNDNVDVDVNISDKEEEEGYISFGNDSNDDEEDENNDDEEDDDDKSQKDSQKDEDGAVKFNRFNFKRMKETIHNSNSKKHKIDSPTSSGDGLKIRPDFSGYIGFGSNNYSDDDDDQEDGNDDDDDGASVDISYIRPIRPVFPKP